jgi:arylsulfatase A-like enzyme
MKRLLLPSLVLFFFCSLQAAGAEKPNVLFLLSDDHSYPYVSAYGDTNVKTPTLDRLAAEGMKFHRFFTGCPQCVPSRACYMTGRSPVAARMTRFSSPLPRDEITFPELLREQGGYYTGVCGRNYHLDGAAPGRIDSQIADVYNEHRLRTFADRVDFLNTCPDNQVADQVAAFLDKRPAYKPFFMWANFSDPHHPWNAPAEFRPDPSSLKIPGHWPDLPGVRSQLADYCAEVNRVDRTIAGVLEVLAQRSLLDKTLIIFAGDNGQALPHGKGSLYDPGSNVPFLVRWPGVVKAGGESRALVSGEDVGPTLLAAAGLSPHPRMTGKSILPLLKGEAFTPRKHVFVERGPHGSAPVNVNIASSSYDLSRAVRTGRYKLIYNCTPWIPYSPVDSAGGELWSQMKAAHASGSLPAAFKATYFSSPRPVYELYDLEADPWELNNLSGKRELGAVEHDLRLALAEKMILDFDYLPLPALESINPGGPATGKAKAGKGAGKGKKKKGQGS